MKGKVIVPLFLFGLLYLLWNVSYAAPFIRDGNLKPYNLYKNRITYGIMGDPREVATGLQLSVADKQSASVVDLQKGSNVPDDKKEVPANRGNGDASATVLQGMNSTTSTNANETVQSVVSCGSSLCRESAKEEEAERLRTKPA